MKFTLKAAPHSISIYLFVAIDTVISNPRVVTAMSDCYVKGTGMNKFPYDGLAGSVVRASCWVLIRNKHVSKRHTEALFSDATCPSEEKH